ncbi:DNA polymerase II [Candidatus Woesearchaeota archaeon]|nr:DNA polymerase II [Candidatus Woesearchaeota archaeon]
MKAFIVYPTYRIIDNKAYVYLFGRLENGESFLSINQFRPYFFIRTKDKDKLGLVKTDLKYDLEDTKLKSFFGDKVTKLTLDVPSSVPEFRDALHKQDILTYEADIRFVYRFMIDNGIKGSMNLEGEFKKGNYVDRIYEQPEITPAYFKPELRTLSIDIETSMDLKEVYSISLYSKDFEKVLIVSSKKLNKAESFGSEKELLERFKEIIHNYDPDIITGWNLIDFDFKILKEKFDQHKIPFILGRAEWHGKIRIFDSFFKDSTADIAGRVVLDGMHLLRISFIGLSDYRLQTAAEEILGDTKLDVFGEVDKGEEIERLFREEPQKLVDYNLKDSVLVYKILEKKGIIDLTIQRSLLTGMQLDRVRSSIASLDNLYLRETMKQGYVCSTGSFRQREERIKGGFVKDSVPGIYDFINVLDFKSLYPSIIRTFNIDPMTFIPKELHKKYNSSEVITAPNGAWFKKEEGILPRLIQELWKQRDNAKKKNNKEESFAIKITMNSFFGVLANPMCRFYSLDMANAITHFGQYIVKKTAELAEEKKYRVIYSDTDSIFVETKAGDAEKAKKQGDKISVFINKFWKNYAKSEFGMESFLELQFEKTFVRFIMPKIRGTEKGAKKRYAGLLINDGKEKIDFTGLEFVRRDWTEVSKKFQLELLDRIFHKKEVVDYIKKFVSDLKKGKYDNLLIYKKAIRKNLDQYTKTTPPHVKAARKLKKLTSSIISYVMTTDGPEPVQQITHAVDYDHYIEKQLKPIADSILVFYDKSFDELLQDTKQTSLFKFG